MSILKRWDEDYNNNTGIPWSEFVKTVDKSNYSPELFNDNGSGDNADDDENDDLYPEDDNLYSDEEIAAWEKERAGNAKASKDVTFITVHPNGGEGHVIAIDDEKKVVSPNAGEFKGTTLSSAKSVGLDELEKKSSEKPSKKVKSKSDDDDEPAGAEKGTKEYYQAKVDKYEKRLKMYAMKMEALQKKIDAGDTSAAEELEKYKKRQARVEKKLSGYKKNLEKFNGASTPSISSAKSDSIASGTSPSASSTTGDKTPAKPKEPAKKSKKSTNTILSPSQLLKVESAIVPPGAVGWADAVLENVISVDKAISKLDAADMSPAMHLAVDFYVKGDYRSFNKAIVGSSLAAMQSQAVKRHAATFSMMFNKMGTTNDDAVLFRSMNGRHLPKDFLNGTPYVDDQMVSTSASHALSYGWYKENKCELAIFLPSGSKALNISGVGMSTEYETLLPPGTVYKYVKTLGYRKAGNETEAHPVYAVVAYTPKEINMKSDIDKNLEVMESIRNTGEMPSEFHKGVYDIAARYANKQVGSYELDVNFGYSVSTKQVMDYYEKYKDKFQGGAVTPKGVHKNWEAYVKPVEASSGLTKEEIKVIVDGAVPKMLKLAMKSGNNIQLSDLEDIVEIEMGDLYAKHLLPTITKAKSEAAFKGLQGIQAKDYVAKKALEHLGKLGVPNTGVDIETQAPSIKKVFQQEYIV